MPAKDAGGRGTQPAPAPPSRSATPPPADPPIYRDLVVRWADEGRTVPGYRDPEWARVATAPVWPSGPLFDD
ncbi:hypothetical protein [Streptomyces sp. NPDC048603]|uniref:hypothetical protein n=1 Tax=Streptomyces sp. NPDC048603 TaxID=3365577 RepID=UPI00370F8DBE